MTTRLLPLFALLPLAATPAFAAAPLLSLNEAGTTYVSFLTDASVTHSSNIFYRTNATSDQIYRLTPGLEFGAGGDANSKFRVVAKEEFNAYADNDHLNSQLGSIDATYTYDPQSRLKLVLNAGVAQNAQPNNQTSGQVGDIVETHTIYGSAITDYKATDKSTVETGVRYNGVRYDSYTSLFNNQDSFSIPVSWFYAITDKFDAGFTYQYTYTDIEQSDVQRAAGVTPGAQQINFIGLTCRGQATDKLQIKGNAGIGFLQYSGRSLVLQGDASDNTFNFGLDATWAVTDKTTLSASASRAYSAGALSQGVMTTQFDVGASWAINQSWAASANAGITRQDFRDGFSGHDTILNAGTSLAYTISKAWKTSLSYSYMHDNTTRPGIGDWTAHVITLSASFKY